MADELEIRLSGSGGQGLILAAGILAEAFVSEGRTVAQSQSYEPTSRGGLSRSDLVVSDGEADFPLVSELDYLVVLDQVAVAACSMLLLELFRRYPPRRVRRCSTPSADSMSSRPPGSGIGATARLSTRTS